VSKLKGSGHSQKNINLIKTHEKIFFIHFSMYKYIEKTNYELTDGANVWKKYIQHTDGTSFIALTRQRGGN
jgi:hypothetical protein